MSQHDGVIDNAPGLAVRTDMNAAIQAILSTSMGPIEPTTKYAGQIWYDTTGGYLRLRNQANTDWEALKLGTQPEYIAPVFRSATPKLVLAAAGGDGIYLRPNDKDSASGQLFIGTNGNVSASGSIGAAGTIAANGYVQSNGTFQTSTNLVIIGPASPGNVYLRPNGPASGTGQVYVNTAGTVVAAAGGFNGATLTVTTGTIQSSGPLLLGGSGPGAIYFRPYGASTTTNQGYYDTSGNLLAKAAVYAGNGAAYLNSDGNIAGPVWNNWGANDAYSAINARIEARASAYYNITVTSVRLSVGTFQNQPAMGSGVSEPQNGYVAIGFANNNNNNNTIRYRQLQVHVPNYGWLTIGYG